MQYTISINQTLSLAWGLNAQQAMLFAFLYECPSWANAVTNENGIYFAISKAKIIEEIPLLTDKPDTVYRMLKVLHAKGVIELSSTPAITLVRLTNKGKEWNKKIDGSEKYPTPEGGKISEAGRKKIRAGSEKSPTNQDTNNQDTNNQDKTPLADKPADAFAMFWAAYPNKKAKGSAEKVWAKLKPDHQLAETIISAVQKHKLSADWTKDEGQYIPHPATWLNAKRWEDEVTAAPVVIGHQQVQTKHGGFDQRDYNAGLTAREGGGYAF